MRVRALPKSSSRGQASSGTPRSPRFSSTVPVSSAWKSRTARTVQTVSPARHWTPGLKDLRISRLANLKAVRDLSKARAPKLHVVIRTVETSERKKLGNFELERYETVLKKGKVVGL